MDKPAKLPDPLGPLSMAVPSFSIVSANAEVRGVLEIEEWTTIFAEKEAPTQRFLLNCRSAKTLVLENLSLYGSYTLLRIVSFLPLVVPVMVI